MKSDHPANFRDVTKMLISKEFQESFIISDSSENIIRYVRTAFEILQTVSLDDLAYSFEATKNLYEYVSEGKEQKIYREILEDCCGY
jgi:hypothetical protein